RSLTTARAQWLERLPNYLSSVCKLRIGSYSFRSFYGSSEPGTPPHHDSIPSNPLRPHMVASGRYYIPILPPVLNGFAGGGPRYAANPGLTPSFRRSLPETGCLSQGLPYGKRFAWPCPPKPLSTLCHANRGSGYAGLINW